MHGGSRHGSRGHARSGARGVAKKGGAGSAAGKADTPRRSGTDAARAGMATAGASLPDTDRLARLLQPVVDALGLDLEGVRVTAAGRRRLLRVVVDADGGVTLDTIALASRELSARLDRGTEMGELPYTLEVSSPGVDRPLTQPRHWRRAIGRRVEVPLAGHGGDGAATVTGRITAASHNGITLDCDGEFRSFSFADLGPGKVQVEFGPVSPGDDELNDGEEELGGY
jgi:ribosome maturation factor RimP